MIICTDPRLESLMKDLYKSRTAFMEGGEEDYARIIDCVRDNIMNRHFKDCFYETKDESMTVKGVCEHEYESNHFLFSACKHCGRIVKGC